MASQPVVGRGLQTNPSYSVSHSLVQAAAVLPLKQTREKRSRAKRRREICIDPSSVFIRVECKQGEEEDNCRSEVTSSLLMRLSSLSLCRPAKYTKQQQLQQKKEEEEEVCRLYSFVKTVRIFLWTASNKRPPPHLLHSRPAVNAYRHRHSFILFHSFILAKNK